MKNLVLVLLIVVAAGSLLFGVNQMKEAEQLTAELEKMKTQLTTCDTQARELQKMYDVAVVEAQVQRTLCEEQLKSLRK